MQEEWGTHMYLTLSFCWWTLSLLASASSEISSITSSTPRILSTKIPFIMVQIYVSQICHAKNGPHQKWSGYTVLKNRVWLIKLKQHILCSLQVSYIFVSIDNTTNSGIESSTCELYVSRIILPVKNLTLTCKIRVRQLSAEAFRV